MFNSHKSFVNRVVYKILIAFLWEDTHKSDRLNFLKHAPIILLGCSLAKVWFFLNQCIYMHINIFHKSIFSISVQYWHAQLIAFTKIRYLYFVSEYTLGALIKFLIVVWPLTYGNSCIPRIVLIERTFINIPLGFQRSEVRCSRTCN